jgi:hypothetical protein
MVLKRQSCGDGAQPILPPSAQPSAACAHIYQPTWYPAERRGDHRGHYGNPGTCQFCRRVEAFAFGGLG